MRWSFNVNNYNPNNSVLLPEGKYSVRITDAKETIARNGTEGLEISFEINGHSNKLKHYIWYNHDQVARTNQLIGEFFASFNIGPDEMDQCEWWVGKSGGVYVSHDQYKGRTIAKVAFCLSQEQQEALPKWVNNPVALADDIVCEPSCAPVSSFPAPPGTPVRNRPVPLEDFNF